MVPLRIVAGIGQDALWTRYLQRGLQERHEAVDVRAWSTADEDGQQKVAAAIERCLEFGEAAVSDAMQAWFSCVATAYIVVAASAAVQAGGVQSDARKASPPLKEAEGNCVPWRGTGGGLEGLAAAADLPSGEW
jgi:hypothetical protein